MLRVNKLVEPTRIRLGSWNIGSLTGKLRELVDTCKENGPLTHLLWILVFDDQHNQIGLMNLQVIVL